MDIFFGSKTAIYCKYVILNSVLRIPDELSGIRIRNKVKAGSGSGSALKPMWIHNTAYNCGEGRPTPPTGNACWMMENPRHPNVIHPVFSQHTRLQPGKPGSFSSDRKYSHEVTFMSVLWIWIPVDP
jgi:hypothetical protein